MFLAIQNKPDKIANMFLGIHNSSTKITSRFVVMQNTADNITNTFRVKHFIQYNNKHISCDTKHTTQNSLHFSYDAT